ncbi:hypothetical protein A8C32_19075 [Flavivirga aquatica]|uniref:Lipoprotein n=1 Tax=Flavivirga aquatica TaxID=1849968 RepID=A0A1E5T428_9FLAO|nr:hypothetical protein [Flavivirga aquatica]OEK06135.1 hypothetical protein A8C32_19075 [Flavivirga aquatica]
MKLFKNTFTLLILFLGMLSFSKCASTQKLEKKLPISIGDVYYEHWVAGIKGGGSGFNVFIPVTNNTESFILDSVYFKGRRAKLEYKNKSTFIGRFKTKANQKQDYVMSSDSNEEYGNTVYDLPKKIPFALKEDECIVSYKENKTTKYYKISNIIKKESQSYPTELRKRQ